MSDPVVPVSCTPCAVREVAVLLASAVCPQCGAAAARVGRAHRTAIDLDLSQPVILLVHVSVHRCTCCGCYFRVQPSFLRKDHAYTERVIRAAVAAVQEDGMAFRRVSQRLARDFWVRPSEASIRRWCRQTQATLACDASYQQWLLSEFSGILCVDEVYQGDLALLVAVDPAAPTGDRLIGYELLANKPVDSSAVERFLARLAVLGIRPDEVITDGSSLYPRVLAAVWPQAAQQLCLFHETRHLTAAAMAVINQVRKALPSPPHPPSAHLAWPGPLRVVPPSDDPNDPAVQRWQLRRRRRTEGRVLVQGLAACGLSARAIARQTGLSRNTVRRWLESEPVDADLLHAEPPAVEPATRQPRRHRQTPALLAQIHALAAEGLSSSAIAQRTGVHRVTVAKWLRHPLPPLPPPVGGPEPPSLAMGTTVELAGLREPCGAAAAAPPPPWRDWEQVRQVREALKTHRFLFLRQPTSLTPDEAAQVHLLLDSPVGGALGVARRFLLDWWAIWRDANGAKRVLSDAEAHYLAWQTDPAFADVPALARVQEQVTPGIFTRLSQFLRHPDWEATNNGAERAGRSFRHRQQAHFNLRSIPSLDGELRRVSLHQRTAAQSAASPAAKSARGRPVGKPNRYARAA